MFGDVIWEQTYNGPGNGDDQAAAIGLDASGNVVVAATPSASGQLRLLRGKVCVGRWAPPLQARYNGPANADDFLTASRSLRWRRRGNCNIDDNQNSNPDIATIRFAPPTDLATQPPTLIAPLENSTQTTPITVTYHLPETADRAAWRSNSTTSRTGGSISDAQCRR